MYRLLPNVFLEYSLIYFVTPSYSVDIFYYSYGTKLEMDSIKDHSKEEQQKEEMSKIKKET
jgi:hypothetical protein